MSNPERMRLYGDEQRYRFVSDDDGHYYLIPADKAGRVSNVVGRWPVLGELQRAGLQLLPV